MLRDLPGCQRGDQGNDNQHIGTDVAGFEALHDIALTCRNIRTGYDNN